MKIEPTKDLASIGSVAQLCECSAAQVEAVCQKLGILAALSLNSVVYLDLPSIVLVKREIERRREGSQ